MVHLFYVFTATQLINMYNLKSSYFRDESVDIYIQTGSRISIELIEKISSSNLFNRVYVNNTLLYDGGFIANLSSIIQKEKAIKKCFSYLPQPLEWIVSLILCVFTNIRLVKVIKASDNYSKYNRIFVGTFGGSAPLIIKCISAMVSDMSLSIVEEGTVNYQRSVVDLCQEYPSIKYKRIQGYWVAKIFGITKQLCLEIAEMVDAIYLYSPDSYPYDENAVIRQIPPLTTDNPASSLLSVERNNLVVDEYSRRKYCYLLQDKTPIQKELFELIVSIVSSEDLILREHPWYPVIGDISKYVDFQDIYVDNSSKSVIFESIVSRIDSEQFVLITNDSSTTFTPKYMFNKEPYIIYLYHITQNRSETDIQNKDRLVESLRGLYANKDRIYVPQSMDDFERYLRVLSTELSNI